MNLVDEMEKLRRELKFVAVKESQPDLSTASSAMRAINIACDRLFPMIVALRNKEAEKIEGETNHG